MKTAITATLCLVMGALAGGWYMRQREVTERSAPGAVSTASVPAAVPTGEPILVTIPADAIDRMGLQYGTVTLRADRNEIRVPGTVEADGYRQVPVTPVAGGIVTEVAAELGQSVKRGQKMARVFSQELADTQTALIGMDADLEVVHKKMTRLQELVKLGAASQQELEEVEGEHQQHMAHIDQARQKLVLLGLTPAQADQVKAGTQVSSEISIPAPIDGVVLSRTVNLGQVVATGQELFKVTDLSSVWIEGNLLEDDFAAVRKGSQAAITTSAYPGRTYRGTVDYIDPRVDPQTRTAKVRVIVGNADGALRLGMYADLQFTTAEGGRVAAVPPGAIQQIGTNTVVYVPVEKNRFEQKPASEVSAGDRVVTEGSFLLRAESLRQHPEQNAAAAR